MRACLGCRQSEPARADRGSDAPRVPSPTLESAAVAQPRDRALAGDAAAAVSAYRVALTPFRNGNEAEHVGETSSRLALLLAAEGHLEEARALANEAQAVTPTDCVVVRALAMMAAARSLPPGEIEASLAKAAAAINLVPELMPNLKADLLVEQSRVQAAAALAERWRTAFIRMPYAREVTTTTEPCALVGEEACHVGQPRLEVPDLPVAVGERRRHPEDGSSEAENGQARSLVWLFARSVLRS